MGIKGLEFAILPTGWGDNDPGYNFFGYQFETLTEPSVQRKWMRFPLFCVLIKHPDLGYIMYDCGPGLGDEVAENGRRPYQAFIENPAYVERNEFVDERLLQMGISKEDINAIIISHFHWDHSGGLELFCGTKAIKNVYASKKEFRHALYLTHLSSKGYTDFVYFRENIDVEGCEYHMIDEECEFAPGIEVLLFSGHTPAVLGLILHCEEKTYIFPSDAVTSSLNYGPPTRMPGSAYDSMGFVKSVERLHKLQKKYNAEIIFQHDPWKFKEYKTMEFIK